MTDISSGPLEDRIVSLIQTDGPMPVSLYMTLCLHDPQHGYYATRPGLGQDFITAPETSQIFGELLGLWAAHEWKALGAPSEFVLAEAGPGRGVLMEDALRASRRVAGFHEALKLCLIEASPALRNGQAHRLAPHAPQFFDEVSDLPDGPLILIANELLDCLPARQFVSSDRGWHERMVGLNKDGRLQFVIGPKIQTPIGLPTPDRAGLEVDLQPGLETLIDQFVYRGSPFRALFIDYGPGEGTPGDTLRSYRSGQQIDSLEAAGTSDLTVDVDFARLSSVALKAGLSVSEAVPQGQFLMSLGAQARLDQLVNTDPDRAEQIFEGADQLINPAKMGERFKVICISSAGLAPPAALPV